MPTTSRRRGVTLTELLIATAVTGIIAATVSALAVTVESASAYNRNLEMATQNARVVLDRLERTMRSAYANERVPGIIPISTTVGTYVYPDAVAVWTPLNRTPADTSSTGLPRYSELTIYCPSPTNSAALLEITRPTDSTVAVDPTNSYGWATTLNTFATSTDSTVRTLTSMLRTASVASVSGGTQLPASTQLRGCVRFETQYRPTVDQLNVYRNLSTSNQTYANWQTVAWPQDLYSRNSGTRQAWCRIELQLMPDPNWKSSDPYGLTAVPFFGSASLYYEIPR